MILYIRIALIVLLFLDAATLLIDFIIRPTNEDYDPTPFWYTRNALFYIMSVVLALTF